MHTDLALYRYFAANYVGRFIDIGCNDPISGSNTHLFYEKGWSGISIDPVAEKIQKHRKTRHRDIILECAVGSYDGEIEFYQCEVDSVSSVLKNVVEENKCLHFRKVVPVKTLATILRELSLEGEHWDLMSIDVEGYEKQVLEGVPFENREFRPKIIVLEGCYPCTHTPCHEDWEYILTSFGYEYRETCVVNRIYEYKGVVT